MHDNYTKLLAAAIRAPSGDNTQPWRFVIDPAAQTIAIRVDETRDPSPMNSGQRMARIAVGAALENLLRTAGANGWTMTLEKAQPPNLVLLHIEQTGNGGDPMESVIADRVTNRRLYDGRPPSPQVLERLVQQTPNVDSITTHWIVDRDRLTALASLIGRADGVMFGEPSMRRAFLSKVRFDAPADAAVEEGLPLAALELSRPDRLALRLLPHLPNWLVKFAGVTRALAAKARQLATSASGLCFVVAADATPPTDVLVGRAMQRAWLALTGEGLAVQPMMSLPVLENVRDNAPPQLLARIGQTALEQLRQDCRTLIPEIGAGRPAFLMRFGYAPPPTGRCGRLPVEASLSQEHSTTTE